MPSSYSLLGTVRATTLQRVIFGCSEEGLDLMASGDEVEGLGEQGMARHALARQINNSFTRLYIL